MRKSSQALLAVVLVAGAVAVVGSGTAVAITVEPSGEVTFSGPLTLASRGAETRCQYELPANLLEGPIAEREGETFGSTSGGVATECSPARARATVLPSSDLRIVRILRTEEGRIIGKLYVIENWKVLLAIPFEVTASCLYAGDVGVLANVDRTGEPGPGTVLPGQSTLTLTGERLNSLLCPPQQTVEGTLAISPDVRLRD